MICKSFGHVYKTGTTNLCGFILHCFLISVAYFVSIDFIHCLLQSNDCSSTPLGWIISAVCRVLGYQPSLTLQLYSPVLLLKHYLDDHLYICVCVCVCIYFTYMRVLQNVCNKNGIQRALRCKIILKSRHSF